MGIEQDTKTLDTEQLAWDAYAAATDVLNGRRLFLGTFSMFASQERAVQRAKAFGLLATIPGGMVQDVPRSIIYGTVTTSTELVGIDKESF